MPPSHPNKLSEKQILGIRLDRQALAGSRLTTPADVVARLGAVQAQDYLGALWAVGCRMKEGSERVVEQALADRSVVRTYPLRGTLHFVAAADVHWMLRLLAPAVLARQAGRLAREFELNSAVLRKSRRTLLGALQGGNALSRNAVYRILEAAGVRTSDSRGLHVLWTMAHEGVLCFGPRHGKQQTFVLLDEWIAAPAPTMSREEALGTLACRYLDGHGPATARDFAWWAGLGIRDAAMAILSIRSQLEEHAARGQTYWSTPRLSRHVSRTSTRLLLPGYDEYVVGYQDRDILRPSPGTPAVNVSTPSLIKTGKVVGTWQRSIQGATVEVSIAPSSASGRAFTSEAKRYAAFVGMELKLVEQG